MTEVGLVKGRTKMEIISKMDPLEEAPSFVSSAPSLHA